MADRRQAGNLMPNPYDVGQPIVSDAALRKVARAGRIDKTQFKKLRRFLLASERRYRILCEAKKDSRTHRQQLALLKRYAAQLKGIVRIHEEERVLRSLLTAAELRRVDRLLPKGRRLERALDRIPKQVRRRIGILRRLQGQVKAAISELKDGPVLSKAPPASQDALDDLTIGILRFWRRSGLLIKNRVSLGDPLVAFSVAVFKVVAGRSEKPSFMRRRLADRLKKLGPRPTPQVPSLGAERRTRRLWRSRIAQQLEKIAAVSKREAKEFADDFPLDLGMSPRDAARRIKREWEL